MGMGITAVKLTALGRPQLLVSDSFYCDFNYIPIINETIVFQLQLSEVIMRARQYMSDVIGGEGAILAQHVKPDDFRKKFEEAHMKDEASVQKFLQKIQADKEGYARKLQLRSLNWVLIFTQINKIVFVHAAWSICFRGAAF